MNFPTQRAHTRNPKPLAYLVRNGGRPKGDAHPGIADYAARLGYELREYDLANAPSQNALCHELHAEGIRGVLLGNILPPEHEIEFDWSLFSVVGLTTAAVCRRFHHVGSDPFENLHLLWRSVFAKGYRRIGVAIIQHGADFIDDIAREAATRFCQERYLTREEAVPTYLEPSGALEFERFDDWIREWNPDVVIGFHVGLFYRLRRLGLSIPEEIGFALLRGSPDAFRQHHLGGLDVRKEEISRVGVEWVDRLIRTGEKGRPSCPLSIHVPAAFTDGPTLKA